MGASHSFPFPPVKTSSICVDISPCKRWSLQALALEHEDQARAQHGLTSALTPVARLPAQDGVSEFVPPLGWGAAEAVDRPDHLRQLIGMEPWNASARLLRAQVGAPTLDGICLEESPLDITDLNLRPEAPPP
eukprot:1260721-Pyramimonas_sp.AAC.1